MEKENYKVEFTDEKGNKKEVICEAQDPIEKILVDPDFDPEEELFKGIADEYKKSYDYDMCKWIVDGCPEAKEVKKKEPYTMDLRGFSRFLYDQSVKYHKMMEDAKEELPGGKYYEAHSRIYPNNPTTEQDIHDYELLWETYYDLYGEAESAVTGRSKGFNL